MRGPPFLKPLGIGGPPILAKQPVVFSVSPITTVPRDWLVAGYANAYDRFMEASQHPDSPELLFIPLFDALNWAGVLEDDARPHTDDLLRAIRFVRNRVVH